MKDIDTVQMVKEVIARIDTKELTDAIVEVVNRVAMVETSRKVMEIVDVSRYLGCNLPTVYRLIRQNKIPVIYVGGRKKVPKDELFALLENGRLIIRGSRFDKWHYLNTASHGEGR